MYQDVKFIKGVFYYEEIDGKYYPLRFPIVAGGRGQRGTQGIQGPAGGFVPAITDNTLIGDGSALNPLGLPYKIYVALITQTSVDAPTAEILENTLSGPIIWSRVGDGTYHGTLSNAFPVSKTWGISGYIANSPSGLGAFISRQDNDIIVLNSVADDNLQNTPIEIRVYP